MAASGFKMSNLFAKQTDLSSSEESSSGDEGKKN